jgi:hypothetical protein
MAPNKSKQKQGRLQRMCSRPSTHMIGIKWSHSTPTVLCLKTPHNPKGKKGKAGMTDFYKSVPDIHDEVTRIFVEGNVAVVEFVSTGTIDGQKFSIPICTVLTVADALVVQDNTYYDATN